MADASKGDNITPRTAGGGGSGAPPTMRFSVEDSNGLYPRSAGGGASVAPRTMDECEGATKMVMEQRHQEGFRLSNPMPNRVDRAELERVAVREDTADPGRV